MVNVGKYTSPNGSYGKGTKITPTSIDTFEGWFSLFPMVGWCGDVLWFPWRIHVFAYFFGVGSGTIKSFPFPFFPRFLYGFYQKDHNPEWVVLDHLCWGSSSSLDTFIFFCGTKDHDLIFNRSFRILGYVQRNHMICKSIYIRQYVTRGGMVLLMLT